MSAAVHVEQAPDGKWRVIRDNGEEVASGLSNGEAWKLFDRLMSEPNTRREDVSDWIARKEASR